MADHLIYHFQNSQGHYFAFGRAWYAQQQTPAAQRTRKRPFLTRGKRGDFSAGHSPACRPSSHHIGYGGIKRRHQQPEITLVGTGRAGHRDDYISPIILIATSLAEAYINRRVTSVFSLITAIILAALSIQYIIDGLQTLDGLPIS